MTLTHESSIAAIPPSVKIQVKCRREHIDVLDLEPKDEPRGLLKKGIGESQKLKLAEEIIKDFLSNEGLEFNDVGEKFAMITVADVIAEEE